jgi:tagatose 1,6-diphosphate aldolase
VPILPSAGTLAAEAGAKFNGVLCGRATWKDGIAAYAKDGVEGLRKWLLDEGIKNISRVNECIRTATPWYGNNGVEAAA